MTLKCYLAIDDYFTEPVIIIYLYPIFIKWIRAISLHIVVSSSIFKRHVISLRDENNLASPNISGKTPKLFKRMFSTNFKARLLIRLSDVTQFKDY